VASTWPLSAALVGRSSTFVALRRAAKSPTRRDNRTARRGRRDMRALRFSSSRYHARDNVGRARHRRCCTAVISVGIVAESCRRRKRLVCGQLRVTTTQNDDDFAELCAAAYKQVARRCLIDTNSPPTNERPTNPIRTEHCRAASAPANKPT